MYDSSMKYKWDNQNVLNYAREEGKLEGKLEGKFEEAREIARTFKKMGLPLKDIAKGTGLSIEEIEKL
jgi:predicted transposase/invertase (TIGR01784 family)